MRTYLITVKPEGGDPLCYIRINFRNILFSIMYLVFLMSIGAGLWEFTRWLVS